MKLNRIIFLLMLGILLGCQKRVVNQNVVTIDVDANYPEKEFRIQDFADVEYVPLETTDSFITQGAVQSIGEKYIIVKNYINDGNIFIFDRKTGKGLKVINRLGQSGEEYTNLTNVVLSEMSNEIFVSDYPARKIFVYDINGTFKRCFPFADTSYYSYLADYDTKYLIAFKGYSPNIENEKSCHILISKENGNIEKEIKVPISKLETVVWSKEGATITPNFVPTVASTSNWILTRMSSDTIYCYNDNDQIEPILARTPSIHSMEIQKFLYLIAETKQYYFLQTLKKEFNLEKMKGFEAQNLIYDKREKAVFTPIILNDDYSDKREVSIEIHEIQVDRNVFAFQSIEACNLIEANKEGILKSRLKSLVSNLDEQSNPVIMILKSK